MTLILDELFNTTPVITTVRSTKPLSPCSEKEISRAALVQIYLSDLVLYNLNRYVFHVPTNMEEITHGEN